MICSSAAIVASSSSANWPCLRADSLPRLARQGPDVMDLIAEDAGLADVDLPRTWIYFTELCQWGMEPWGEWKYLVGEA